MIKKKKRQYTLSEKVKYTNTLIAETHLDMLSKLGTPATPTPTPTPTPMPSVPAEAGGGGGAGDGDRERFLTAPLAAEESATTAGIGCPTTTEGDDEIIGDGGEIV